MRDHLYSLELAKIIQTTNPKFTQHTYPASPIPFQEKPNKQPILSPYTFLPPDQQSNLPVWPFVV